MKINTYGITRIVIELNSIVIKIPNFTHCWKHFLQGILANINENLTWKYAVNNAKELLCPVIWCSWGGWILIMRKAEKILSFDEYAYIDISKHIKHYPGDDKANNYGILKGKLVKIDYGN